MFSRKSFPSPLLQGNSNPLWHVWVPQQCQSSTEGMALTGRFSLACQHSVTPSCAQAQPTSDLLGMMNIKVTTVQCHRGKMFVLFMGFVSELSPKWSSPSFLSDSLWLLWHIRWQQELVVSRIDSLLIGVGRYDLKVINHMKSRLFSLSVSQDGSWLTQVSELVIQVSGNMNWVTWFQFLQKSYSMLSLLSISIAWFSPCAQELFVREYKDSKCVIITVQFKIGQTKALTTIMVREHLDSLYPFAPQFSLTWLQRPSLCTASGKKKMKGNKLFQC